ncbi:far upstream element-binding protein 2-like [Photinus pyralis]|nr:far upstream element-binding protein 2-like [Photinus pyralis]XP_031335541.1 far upstream element-binding protein 2-like [Photinus pyralis]
MAPQNYPPQNWGAPAFQQQWGVQSVGNENPPQTSTSVQLNPVTGQPDYSLQWAEYYRSLGMLREAEVIEQQAKTKGVTAATSQPAPAPVVPAVTAAVPNQVTSNSNGSQPDYSAQWAEYYRSLGKHKEAEAIESQMKAKAAGAPPSQQMQTAPSAVPNATGQAPPGNVYQQNYGGYQAAGGYYGGQTQNTNPPPTMPQGQYTFSGYGYPQSNSGQDN